MGAARDKPAPTRRRTPRPAPAPAPIRDDAVVRPGAAAGFDRLRHREYRAPGPAVLEAGPAGAAGSTASAGATGSAPGETSARPPAVPSGPSVGRDAHGKRVLYSGARPSPAPSAGLRLECSRCGGTRLLGTWQSLRVLTPSVHLPVMRARHFSLVRCPNCHRVSWVRLGLHLRAVG
ncbi:hypothetical protein [Candidatus Frankia nodulisporulans]|uniref:hypothetical protein n=1 Tax=Candidatus Frankia nodulisporulans TaxID=2060052 RepID=UPI001CDCD46C|nr:hypothetical protein [Candidatus Frankia nodulisporulans]